MQNQFYSIGEYLKKNFGGKVVKLSLDGGFTCPNRDGSKGVGGCIFCSSRGSGELTGSLSGQIRLLSRKWPDARYLAYFQSHTGTYAPVERLRELYETALAFPGVVGLAVATRPDCLEAPVLELLDSFNRRTFLWVELGLQTIHESTAAAINRCYPLQVFEEAADRLARLGIRTVVHLILGLPGETREMMLESVDFVCRRQPFGIKLHLLNVIKGSPMETLCPDYVSFETMEEYISLAADAIQRIPPSVTIHRITGDAPRNLLISPSWSYEKRAVLNGINRELLRRKQAAGIPPEKTGALSEKISAGGSAGSSLSGGMKNGSGRQGGDESGSPAEKSGRRG